jgi:putative alpha-1,2-mannosidase
MQKYFKPTRDGLHDNEDMGCQSAFYLASALGIYPLYGQDLYWLTTPVFTRSEITLGAGGNRLVIEAPNACPELPYIASARLNGKALDRPWLRHGEIAGGALIQIELAAKPTAWGINQPPPSPGCQG